MSYRGPNSQRITRQHTGIVTHAGEAVTWREYISGTTGTSSAYYAGGGTTRYYQEHEITALLAAPQQGDPRFRETQVAGGMLLGGELVVSTPSALGLQDELVWRGVTYRVEGDSVPIHMGARVWWNCVIKRGDVTG